MFPVGLVCILLGGGDITWAQFGENMIAVYLGNVLGGTVMVGALYYAAYRD